MRYIKSIADMKRIHVTCHEYNIKNYTVNTDGSN